jgi:ABC-2 type transport system ATP-binding protein
MNQPILCVSSISKSFGEVQAVDNVSLEIHPGQIYGLVGPDGAGKTTTLRLICGAYRPDSGSVSIGDFSLKEKAEQAREMIGYLSQQFSLYEDLTVLENIRFLAEVRGIDKDDWYPRALENLTFVGLEPFQDRLAGQLSGGMKQKLALACALVNRPQLLLLDEPTTGVDPLTRQDFWQLIIRLAGKQKMAVLICTPYMDEAARCSYISFMRNGKIIQEGAPSQLQSLLEGRILEISGTPVDLLIKIAAADENVEDVQRFGDRLHLRTRENKAKTVEKGLQKRISAQGGTLHSVKPITATLEDVFISLAGDGYENQSHNENGGSL